MLRREPAWSEGSTKSGRGGDVVTPAPNAQDKPFRVEEATIDELHAAIKSGRTTCVAVVQQYIERVRAYMRTA